MLQIDEWFRKPVRKSDDETRKTSNISNTNYEKLEESGDAAPDMEDMFEPEPVRTKRSVFKPLRERQLSQQMRQMKEPGKRKEPEQAQELQPEHPIAADSTDSMTDLEMEQISEKIGLDVTGMIDMEREDILLQQIDEFREKAKQLQELMNTRESKARELQDVVEQRSAKANELDSLIHVRQGEADKIMNNVSQKIDTMSADVRQNLNDVNQNLTGLEGTFQKEVSGLTQNISQEINQSTEKTRQMFEEATKNLINQNTRSLEGLKEQLDQLGQLDQIGELSSEMNTTISTLKTDIADKIHAEDVKCYRNIQASMDEQSKLLSEGDEKTRQHVQELMESLDGRMKKQSRLGLFALVFSVLDFIGILGIVVLLMLL